MRYLSLFSGMGGFDCGFDAAGWECAGQCEIDAAAIKVLEKHWPGVRRWQDVTELNGGDVIAEAIVFGSPCQDLSVAGQRQGFKEGTRSNLFFEAVRIIREMREATHGRFPIFALWENVPGATSSASGRDFGSALNALAESGAVDIAWRIVDAQHWVPQRRRRVFVLACYPPVADGGAGIGRAAEILSLTEGVRRDSAPRRTTGQGVAGTLGGGAGNRGWADDTDRTTFIPTYIPLLEVGARAGEADEREGLGVGEPGDPMFTLQATKQHGIAGPVVYKRRGGFGWSESQNISPTLEAEGGSHQGGPERVPFVAQPLRANRWGGSDSHGDEGNVVLAFAQNTRDEVRLQGGDGAISGALAAEPGMKQTTYIAGPMAVRRLTPTETLRLQAFPDDWFDGLGLSDSHKYRLVGNAVCTAVARWLGERMAAVLAQREVSL